MLSGTVYSATAVHVVSCIAVCLLSRSVYVTLGLQNGLCGLVYINFCPVYFSITYFDLSWTGRGAFALHL